MSDREPGGMVTLDQLTALNDEIAALVRAGVPLERGLVDAGRQIRGKLGARAKALGEHLGRGESLSEALERADVGLPEVYRAVVEAGVRSGRLAKALEGMASLARGYVEARRSVGLALLYPALVVSVAYLLFIGFLIGILPRYVDAFGDLHLPTSAAFRGLGWASRNVTYWAPILPLFGAILLLRWTFSGRASALDSGAIGSLAGRIPWIGRMLSDFRAANFAELLALLLDHHVPLDEAVMLGVRASGSKAFRRSGEAFAGELRTGGPPGIRPRPVRLAFPPLLAWLVTAGHRQGDLAGALRQSALTYRRRAEGKSDLLWSTIPVVLMIGIGAGTVLIYAALLLYPLRALWEELALPN